VIPRVFLLVAVAVAALALASEVAAHDLPARRSIDVQVEDEALVLLVTWQAPSGPLADLMTARAAWGRPGAGAAAAVEEAMAALALAPIVVRAGGRMLEVRALRTMLLPDRGGRRLFGVAVLVEIVLEDPGLVTLEVTSEEPTRLRWRSRAIAEVMSTTHPQPDRWRTSSRLLALLWRPT
jgi:hypothetical protein